MYATTRDEIAEEDKERDQHYEQRMAELDQGLKQVQEEKKELEELRTKLHNAIKTQTAREIQSLTSAGSCRSGLSTAAPSVLQTPR